MGWGPGKMLDLAGLQLEIDCSGGVGDELDCQWDVLWLNPDVPVVQICPQFGSLVEITSGFSKDCA